MSCPRTIIVACCLMSLLASGCHLRPFWLRKPATMPAPEVFAGSPTLEQMIDAINTNTDRVEQLQTDSAILKVKGIPALRANLAYERPRNFRLRAELFQFTGRELDMGSNSDLFWFWVRRDERPTIYYAKHDAFQASPARELIPIEPYRLIDCLGLVHLDANQHHEGPTTREDGRLEVRSQLTSPHGPMNRVILVDPKHGWILEQQLYDTNGQLLVSATASQHRFYPDDGVSIPHHVEVRLMPGQPSQMAFEMDVSSYSINRLYGEPAQLWTVPEIENSPLVNIAAPEFRPPPSAPPTRSANLGGTVYGAPRVTRLPAYRGYDLR